MTDIPDIFPRQPKSPTVTRLVATLPPTLGVIGGVVVCALDTVFGKTNTFGLLTGVIIVIVSLYDWRRYNNEVKG